MSDQGMYNSQLLKKSALTLAITTALAANVQAQDTADQVNEGLLEEVIVTATKRAVSVQDLSLSVTALSAEAIEKGGIQDISGLEAMVPGLQFGSSGNEVRLALRGTRQNNVGTEAEQSVGIFEDGVYVPTSTQAMGSYVDIERIEVLRGPQGTLYGRNTFGGTINIISKKPTFDQFEGNLMGLIGAYDRVKVEAVVNIPFSDTFAMRIAAMADKHDGYIENTYREGPADDLNDQDIQFVRLGLNWQVTEDFNALLKLTSQKTNYNGSAIWGYQQIGGYIDGQYYKGHQYAPGWNNPDEPYPASCCFDQGPWKISRDQASNADTDNFSSTLELNWDLDFATLKFIGNMTDFEGNQNYDADYSDGGDPLNSGFTGWFSSQDTWSTELQLISNPGGRVDWLLGLYYYDQESNWSWLDLNDGTFELPHWDNQTPYNSDSFGAFGHATFHLNDDIRLVGGLRYAEDSKTQKDVMDWSVWPPVPLPNSGSTGSWDDVLWKASGEYDVSDDMMGYFTVSTGYRAGGINNVAPNVPLTYDPEFVTAYELGLKSVLAGGSMTLNVAAYYNDYSDMQAQSFYFAPGDTAVMEFTENGGQVDTTGLEVEWHWIPANNPNWKIGAQFAFMDAEFGTYGISKIQGLGDLGGRQDLDDPLQPLLSLKGYRPALSPEFTAGIQVSYDFELENGSILTPYVQTYYSDGHYGFDVNMPGNEQSSFTKTDIRLIWVSPNGNLEIQGYVRNLEDEAVLNRGLIFNPGGRGELASIQANWGDPRTYGVMFKTRF